MESTMLNVYERYPSKRSRLPRGRRARLAGAAALALTLAACGGSDAGATGPGDGHGSRVPDELVGKWYSGTVSPSNYYDPSTGHWGGQGYTSGVMYTFTPDGHYVMAYQTTSELYDCGTLTLFYVKGNMTVDASRAIYELHPTSAKRIERSNCGGGNSDSEFEDDGESGYYEVAQAEDGSIWLLTRPLDGSADWVKMRRLEQ
jgi:hypothetical protein